MTWFHNLKTKTKLVLGFAAVSAIGVGVGLLGVQSMGSINGMLIRLYERDMLGLSEIKEANINLVYVGRAVRAAVLAEDKSELERHAANIEKYLSDMTLHMDKAGKTLVSEEAKAQLTHIRENLPEYRSGIKQALALAAAGKDREANAEIAKARAIADRFDQAMTAVSASKEKMGREAFDESGQVYQRAVTIMVAVLVLGTLFGIGLGYWIAQAIAGPLSRTVELLRAVAGGDMTRTLEVQTQDEVGQMAAALNEAVSSMRSALMEVRSSADGVSAASQELAAAAEELSSGAQEQAASLEEVASSLEEMTATVKQNADSSRQASTLSGTSRSTAENGGEVVASAVQAMGEINSASKRIADIITAIDEIAFQTNLLALNAAVEAARAGEQGRGFAVVAGEVRNLAQRSATAAKEIKTLINDSVRKVENGSELVNQSGKTLHEIVTSVKRVNDIVTEISAASQEQAGGIEQVNKAMVQIDQVTQATVSQTEELSSTAQGMSAQAEQMLAMVARFRLDQDSELRRQAAAPRAAEMKKPVQRGTVRSSGPKTHISKSHGSGVHAGNGGSNGHARSSAVALADLEPPAGAFSEF